MTHHCSLRLFLSLIFAFVQLLPFSFNTPVQAQADHHPLPAAQSIEPWLDAQLNDGVLYLLYASPARIMRYNLSNQSWLSSLLLPAIPTAFRVDGSQIFVAMDKTLARFNLDGTGQKNLWSSSQTINQVVVDKQFAFVCLSSMYDDDLLFSIDRNTGNQIDAIENYRDCTGISIAPGLHRLFSLTKKIVGSSDIHLLNYSITGELDDDWTDSSYHGYNPNAQTTWVFPDESLVIDSSGTIYTTNQLVYHNTLIEAVTDLAFAENQLIVLRGGILYSYDNRLVEHKQYAPSQPPQNIFISGDIVYALRASLLGPIVDIISLNLFQPPVPAEPLDGYGLPYTIDDLAFDPAGTIYLMNKASRNILRWSIAARAYLEPITLTREPQFITYSPTSGKLFIAYNNKDITQISPAQGLSEIPFAALKQVPCALAAAGTALIACDNSIDLWNHRFFTINPAGDEVSSWTVGSDSIGFAWSEAQSRMYYTIWGYYSVNWADISPEGAVTSENSYYDYPNLYTDSISLSDNQTRLFAGPRTILDITPPNVTLAGSLPEDMVSASWMNNTLYTLKADSADATLQQWNADLTLAASQNLTGSPLYLFSTAEGLLAITDFNGRPRFTLWNAQLEPLYQPPAVNFSISETTGVSPLSVKFSDETRLFGENAAYLWDFGDGQTSTEINPTHTYTQLGKYTVSLTVTESTGKDRSIRKDLIQVLSRIYLPIIQLTYPTTNYTNVCQTFPLRDEGGWLIGAEITECVPKIENRGSLLRVYFTWRIALDWPDDCVDKKTDKGNPNMYITDQKGNRYAMVDAGERALWISCMADGYPYTGWFDFPAAKVSTPVFTFHDDDHHIQLGPLPAP
jgi:PKD repeat protein